MSEYLPTRKRGIKSLVEKLLPPLHKKEKKKKENTFRVGKFQASPR